MLSKSNFQHSGFMLAEALISFFLLMLFALVVVSGTATHVACFNRIREELAVQREIYQSVSEQKVKSSTHEGIAVDVKTSEVSVYGKKNIYLKK